MREREAKSAASASFIWALAPTALLALVGGACGSGLPALISSSPSEVAVEFASDGRLGETSEIASRECAELGKTAGFIEVDTTATPKTRIARYRCVSSTGEEPAASSEAVEAPGSD